MLIFPAIDIQNRQCVRLYKGDFDTVHRVAENPLDTALAFAKAGASWVHMVDLDGAKNGVRTNADIFLEIAAKSGLQVQLGGGIRDMQTLDYYFSHGISRCILGSAALKNPTLIHEAVRTYGSRIAVGIDAVNGMVATEGWLDVSETPYLALAKRMEDSGVRTLIFTDIARDGTLEGPNTQQLETLVRSVSCNIIASGGMRELSHIQELRSMHLYGAICGKSLYSGTLDLHAAISAGSSFDDSQKLNRFFETASLIPVIVQEADTNEVLMLAYMNRGALIRTLETGFTWFWSRSRHEYWNKGATSGHVQQVVSLCGDCDEDTLLVRVHQTGNACHTGMHSCFFKEWESTV